LQLHCIFKEQLKKHLAGSGKSNLTQMVNRASQESLPAKSVLGDDASEKTAMRNENVKSNLEQQLKGQIQFVQNQLSHHYIERRCVQIVLGNKFKSGFRDSPHDRARKIV
jgi:hypothetical protein